MIRPVLRMGDPRLLRVSRPVSDPTATEITELLRDMRETMAALNGAGLAAPQIGVDLRVVIFGSGQVNPRYPAASPIPPTVLINPQLDMFGAADEGDWEGCLSVPGLRGWVPRYRRLRYRGLDDTGALIDREVEGFHARVVQHECDHLDGILYPMLITDFSRFGFQDVLFPDGNLPVSD